MANIIRLELAHNFEAFDKEWPTELIASRDAITPCKRSFEESYVRICSIQAWRINVVRPLNLDGPEAFFFEAQNDLLTSHWLARCGAFRPALKALRSAIENIYFSLFYKDHSVELAQWELGKHKLGFTELHKYVEAHPLVDGRSLAKDCLAELKSEYATLSKAVHGSAKAFRMTQNLEDIRLWSADPPSVSKWAAREKSVISNINLLLLHFFYEQLQGASKRDVRNIISCVIPQSKHGEIKASLQVKLRT